MWVPFKWKCQIICHHSVKTLKFNDSCCLTYTREREIRKRHWKSVKDISWKIAILVLSWKLTWQNKWSSKTKMFSQPLITIMCAFIKLLLNQLSHILHYHFTEICYDFKSIILSLSMACDKNKVPCSVRLSLHHYTIIYNQQYINC